MFHNTGKSNEHKYSKILGNNVSQDRCWLVHAFNTEVE